MSLEYIRNYYDVPAKKGMRVTYRSIAGVITGSSGPHVRVRLDRETRDRICHATDLTYIPEIVLKAEPDTQAARITMLTALLREQQTFHWIRSSTTNSKVIADCHLALHNQIKAALGDES